MRVRSEQAVITQYVVRNLLFGFFKRTIASIRYPLRFQTPKEPFHRTVIPAISPSTHTLHHLVSPDLLSKRQASVLTTLVGVKHHTFRVTSRLICHHCSGTVPIGNAYGYLQVVLNHFMIEFEVASMVSWGGYCRIRFFTAFSCMVAVEFVLNFQYLL